MKKWLMTWGLALSLILTGCAQDGAAVETNNGQGSDNTADSNQSNGNVDADLGGAGEDSAADPDSPVSDQDDDGWETELTSIAVPNMSPAILDADESEQLQWLADVYEFEIGTMRSKTLGLTDDDLQLVREHLSQVYGAQETELLIEGFYNYNEDEQAWYVPDGSWFTYNEHWRSAALTVVERSAEAAILKLTGVDDYGDNEREIDYHLSVQEDQLFLQQRDYIK